MPRCSLIALSLSLLGCGFFTLPQPDGFQTILEAGCETNEDCGRLHSQAEVRADRCCEVDCAASCLEARRDVRVASNLVSREWTRYRQEYKAALAANAAASDERQAQRETNKKAQKQRRLDRMKSEKDTDTARLLDIGKQHARLAAAVKKRPVVLAVLSYRICLAKRRIKDDEKDLAREKRIAARAGVTDLRVAYDVASRIEHENDLIRKWTESLRTDVNATPTGCGASFQRLQDCVNQPAPTVEGDMFAEARQEHERSKQCPEPLTSAAAVIGANMLR